MKTVAPLRRAGLCAGFAFALLVGCHTPNESEASVPADSTSAANHAAPPDSGSASRPVAAVQPQRVPPPAAPSKAPSVPPAAEPIVLFPGVTIVTGPAPRVELEARTCLEEGWLEQIACMAGTREHESLVVPRATPSQVHAALLAIGLENGRPGRWTMENEELALHAPTGAIVDVTVRWTDGARERETSIWTWVHEPGRDAPAKRPFVFGGSKIVETPEGEIYLADHSGSIIGLVTFGDEVIGCAVVFSDDQSIQEPAWQVARDVVPPYGTDVTLIIRPRPAPPAPDAAPRTARDAAPTTTP